MTTNDSQRPHILIVDDEPLVLQSTAELLGNLFEDQAIFVTASSTDEALEQIAAHQDSLAVAVVDYNLGESKKTGEHILKATRRLSDHIYNILNTAYGTKDIFKRGVNEGWLDAIAEKEGDLDSYVKKGLLQHRERYGRRDEYLSRLTTSSEAFQQFLSQVKGLRRPSQGKGYLLIGERGTGKQVIAELIHLHFGRLGAFLSENCATYDNNAEMQLFGVAEKAFPDVRPLPGAVKACEGGTLFLDELHALDESTQRKLNRLIEYGDYSPYGDPATKKQSDALIVAATNQPLVPRSQGGWMNEDLRDRFIVLEIPPLRDRLDDLEGLVENFVAKHLPDKFWEGARPSPDQETLRSLKSHSWPGNVRMVENCVLDALNGYTGLRPEEFCEKLKLAGEKHHREDSSGKDKGIAFPDLVVDESSPITSLAARVAEILEMARERFRDEGWATLEKKVLNGAYLHLCTRYGSQIEVAQKLGIPRATLNARVKQAELLGLEDATAAEVELDEKDNDDDVPNA